MAFAACKNVSRLTASFGGMSVALAEDYPPALLNNQLDTFDLLCFRIQLLVLFNGRAGLAI